MRPAKCETEAKAEARYHKAEAEVEAKAKAKKNLQGQGRTLWGRGRGWEERCRINYKLLIWIQLKKYCNYTVMIVSSDSVNAIVLPYVWQLTDNYGYTHYYLQTSTLSKMVAIHSWPDFDDLPRGHEAHLSENEASVARGQGRGRSQMLYQNTTDFAWATPYRWKK